MKNKLYYGDNLIWLRDQDHFPGELVDLIYLDPPFNSDADYGANSKGNSGKKSQTQLLAFDDIWNWDKEVSALALNEMGSNVPDIAQLIKLPDKKKGKASKNIPVNLELMATRLLELHRVLKPTGSICLHCNYEAVYYLKEILDAIFGKENLRNAIVWKRAAARSDAKKGDNVHDVILCYSKSSQCNWNPQYLGRIQSYKASFCNKDAGNKHWTDDIANPDMIIDISPISLKAAERLGYHTQKPIALLERIIKAGSNEGDIILDPFCGCGTSIVAAQKLKRRWIGIDITQLAIYLTEQRLKDSYGKSIKDSYELLGNPCDVASAKALWSKNEREFELWALSLVGAKPRIRNGGIEGILGFAEIGNKKGTIVVQIKGSTYLVRGMIDDMVGLIEKEGAAIGLLITLHKPTLGMITDTVHAGSYQSELWNRNYLKIQLRTVNDLLEGKSFDIPQTYSLLKKSERVKSQEADLKPLL